MLLIYLWGLNHMYRFVILSPLYLVHISETFHYIGLVFPGHMNFETVIPFCEE